MTASRDPKGYAVHAPGKLDNGTFAPTAALSSWPYTPKLAESCMDAMFNLKAPNIWGEFGFYDAFNIQQTWVTEGHISIDLAPIAPMIENHRTGFCWDIFNQSEEAKAIQGFLNQ